MKFLPVLLSVGLFQVNATYDTTFHLDSALGETEDPVALVHALISSGGDIEIDDQSVTLTGPSAACAKQFFGGLNLVPDEDIFFDEGIILSTGTPTFIQEQNSGEQSSCFSDSIYDGDEILSALIGMETYDACILEFKFKPAKGLRSLWFNYAFGSEEYLEYVGSEFNDGFVLLLNGENIAIVPGTEDTAVSINTLNDNTNSHYYIDNDPGKLGLSNVPYPNMEADGFTIKLTASGNLIEDEWNTLSIRIADVMDCLYDSWVLLEARTMMGLDTNSIAGGVTIQEESGGLPTAGGATGDPHFIMWSGEKYDFHGVCDLVLLENPTFGLGKGMDVHVRTKKTRRWSYISSAALRIGEETFEVRQDGHYLNGKKDASLESGIAGYSITYEHLNVGHVDHKQKQYVVTLNSKESILFRTFQDMIRVDVKSTTGESFKDSHGLMGTYGSNSMRLGRDYTTVINDFDEFGKEWQVRAHESSLFHNVEGPQAPAECVMPTLSTNRRRLGELKVSYVDAEIACARLSERDRDMCIFDVLAIDDIDVAGAY